MAQTSGLTHFQREARIRRELLDGNIPDFLRSLEKIIVTRLCRDGRRHSAEFWVTRDYLAIGPDADFVRMPMGSRTAQEVADAFGCVLPTKRMVDAIHSQAGEKLMPKPLPPGPRMMSNGYYETHNGIIQGQLGGRVPGELIAGHKKDVVNSVRLQWYPDRVAIYGWHYPGGTPIQPLSTVHVHWYHDYSHGVRLIHQIVTVDGRDTYIGDVLRDAILHKLLSDEGPLPERIP
jgi:hypothetical protein